ncbi:hypothetical protein SAMN04487910_4168 [Aquimarina amphilecti]|uniref:YhhN-like protein n=1 Tax=Aquimarina amphilecti TaxID=1038014 RepID=A0A1H7VSK1_AQUAM|nr:hypothetical protein SAMN04487910_4168 [Aquimarina amphilecti]
MRFVKLSYALFYFSYIVVIIVALFFDRIHLIYVKPLVPISLIFIYVINSKSVNFFFIISMIVIAVNDTLVYIDFDKYFDIVGLLIVSFYLINVFLLRNYISLKDIKFKEFVSFPIIISFVLISYLIFSVSQLVIPVLVDSIFTFFMILLVLLFFVGTCFFIYIIDKYKGNFKLFVSASCCLFVNALLLISHFYYYAREFTILANLAEIAGLYFFLKFLIDARLIDEDDRKINYLKDV